MTLNILGVALENCLIVVVRVGGGIGLKKSWDIVMILPIRIGAGIIMQLWMP